MKRYLLTILLCVRPISLIGAYQVGRSVVKPHFMTRCEIQQMLCDMGYKVKIDGEIGRKSNAAWALAEEDKANEYFAQFFTVSGAPE